MCLFHERTRICNNAALTICFASWGRGTMNTLFYGDNLVILRDRVPAESVDLIYLDPPFNSNRSYNVLFKSRSGKESAAQIEAFDDTWTWSDSESGALLHELTKGGMAPRSVSDTLLAMERILGRTDLFAYLVMMTARLVELHRVLKRTGSLYLHCDPTASHYLKIILDAIFEPRNFRNEITWQRTNAKGLSFTRFASNHDVILYYGKSSDVTWNPQYTPHNQSYVDDFYRYTEPETGRRYRLADLTNPNKNRPNLTYEFLGVNRVWRWTRERMQKAYEDGIVVQTAPGRVPQLKRFLDEQEGNPIGDLWNDVLPLQAHSKERLGYPTQKPVALLERIIRASSNPGDVVLDPFCGCGTAVDAAQRLDRRWIGIDITVIAIDLIKTRLLDTFGSPVLNTFQVAGTPLELDAAERLWKQNPFEFERWAVTLVEGEPNEKQVGDRGIDGIIRFAIDQKMNVGEAIVSVKGGQQLGPAMVRDLSGTISSRKAEMGLMLTLAHPTRGMIEAASSAGVYVWPFNDQPFPRTQIVTIEDLLLHQREPKLPPMRFRPYLAAQRHRLSSHEQLSF